MSTEIQELRRELKEITLHARQLLIANGNSEKNLQLAINTLVKIMNATCLKEAIELAKNGLLQVDNANYLAAYGKAQIKANPKVAEKIVIPVLEKKPAPKKNPGWDNRTSVIRTPVSPKPAVSASVETPKKAEKKPKNGQKWTRGADGKVRRTDGALF